jgi:hypothetical protein
MLIRYLSPVERLNTKRRPRFHERPRRYLLFYQLLEGIGNALLKVGYRGVGMASRCSNSINSGEKVSTVSLGLQGYTELLSTLLHVNG